MSSFIYDDLPVPEGKSDAKPLTVPANKGYTAAEWNLVMSHLKDIRTAILAGNFHGLVESAAALSSAGNGRFRLEDSRLQFSENGKAYKSIGHGQVNVLDFGADPTGAGDSAPAFKAAIESFFPNLGGGSFTSLAGIVMVPPGKYRFASTVSIKRSVLIQGAAGPSAYHSCWICPDKGITGFVFESYNTPVGTADNCSGGFGQLCGLTIEPADVCAKRTALMAVTTGQRFKFGSGIKDDSYRHFEATTDGTTSADAEGPISWGNDRDLNYDIQTHNFTVGREVQGATSGATGYIVTDTDGGTTGTLRLTQQVGTFVDDEIVHEIDADGNVIGGGGSATTNGTTAANNTDVVDGSVHWKYIGLGAGVVMRTAAYIRDCGINATSGNGVHIEAQSRECPGAVCNANGWGINTLTSFGCQGHNVFVRGSDANGGWYVGGYCLGGGGPTSDENFTGQGVNICDMSFLGNTYVSIQFGSGGQGPIISKSVGGGNTFIGCYVEGTGGGWVETSGTCTIIGGGLATNTLYAPNSNPTVIGAGSGRGLRVTIYGTKGFSWLKNANTPLTWRVLNDGNKVYQCITPGKTENTPGAGPTGTGSDIVDGTVHWEYIGPFITDGQAGMGSANPDAPSAINWQWPESVTVGNGYELFYGTASKNGTQVTKVGGFAYGDLTRMGLMLSDSYTELAEWPSWVPAGNALMFETWLGGIHLTTGTGAPTSGNWNKGDIVFYKASAISVNGRQGLECTSPGTAGTYSGGRTLTSSGGTLLTVSGSLMQTLRSGQDFHTGDYITVDSIPTMITSVAKDGMSIGVADVIPAGTWAPTFTAPTFTPFGVIGSLSTADVTDSTNKRYVTDAELATLVATSGTNTGDQTSVSGNAGTATALQTARTIAGVSFNGTANISLTTAGIADSSDKRYVTDAELATLVATSGTNTGDVTLAAVGSAPSANGASLSGQALTLQPADGTHPGLVTTGAQSWAGIKTLLAKLILSGAGSHLEMDGQDADYIWKNLGGVSGHEMGVWQNGGVINTEIDNVVQSALSSIGLVLTGKVQAKSLVVTDYLDDSATAGNRTVDKYRGRNKIAAGQSTCVITNNTVDADKLVVVVLQTNDATAILKNVVANGTGFTVTLTAAATADTVFGWWVVR